jgi:hypothetical protein
MEIVFYLLSIYGMAFFLRNSDGPFDLMSKTRSHLMQNSFVGVFFYNLFSCMFCLGFHCGYMMYLFANHVYNWNLTHMMTWAFAGASFSFLVNVVVDYLTSRTYAK